MDVKIKIRKVSKSNEEEILNFFESLEFDSYKQLNIVEANENITVEFKKEFVGASQISKLLKSLIKFKDFSFSFERNSNNSNSIANKRPKKSQKVVSVASVVSKDVSQDDLKIKKIYEILNNILYESNMYDDFTENISKYFQFKDNGYYFEKICSLVDPDLDEEITSKIIMHKADCSASVLNFFNQKTRKAKVDFLDLVTETRKYKKPFEIGFSPETFFRTIQEKTGKERVEALLEKMNLGSNDENQFIRQVFDAVIISGKDTIEDVFSFMQIEAGDIALKRAEVSAFINNFWIEKTSGYIGCNQFFDFLKRNVK